MKTRVSLIAFALMLLCAGSLFGQRRGDDARKTIEKRFEVRPGGELRLERVAADIQLQTWDKSEIVVRQEILMDVITEDEARRIVERAEEAYSQSGNTVRIEGVGHRRNEHHRFDISLPKSFNIDIDTRGGDIDVRGLNGRTTLRSQGGDIDLRDMKGKIKLNNAGGDLVLMSVEGDVDGHTSGGDIDVNGFKGSAELRTSGGDIRLSDVSDDIRVVTSGGEMRIDRARGNITARTSGGSISASESEGTIRLTTSGGDLSFRSMKGNLRATTSGGDIDGTTLVGTMSLATSGGDIELRDIKSETDASTSGGNISLIMTLTDFSKPHGLVLSTSGGNIDVTLPAKMPASILAEIHLQSRRARRYEGRYDIISDFPLSRTQDEDERGKIIRSEGDINGGGDKVDLKTYSGDIRIRRGK